MRCFLVLFSSVLKNQTAVSHSREIPWHFYILPSKNTDGKSANICCFRSSAVKITLLKVLVKGVFRNLLLVLLRCEKIKKHLWWRLTCSDNIHTVHVLMECGYMFVVHISPYRLPGNPKALLVYLTLLNMLVWPQDTAAHKLCPYRPGTNHISFRDMDRVSGRDPRDYPESINS